MWVLVGTNSQNFPFGWISRAKTFRTERANRFSDKTARNCENSFCDKNVHKFVFAYMPCLSWDTWWEFLTLSGNFSDHPETFKTVWKLSRLARSFPDSLETVQTVRKLSRLAGNLLDSPETFQTLQKLFRLSGNLPGSPEIFQIVRKLSRQSSTF